MNYEPVIGLEVHVELNTKTKMFCRCSADYFPKEKRLEETHFGQASPNTLTCPVCLGLPGALPYANEEAINKCIQIGLALNCSINPRSLFERKNYFYPDLAKGFQISQLRWPLCINGFLEVEDAKGELTKIRINRVHQEEDTGKLTHQFGVQKSKVKSQSEGVSLIDFNRGGVPLVEIVTEPDFTDPIQVRNYAKALQQIFRDLEVSNADMERGDMRLEANISVRPVGQTELPNYRVELKNINSFRFMVAAVDYEIRRQIEALEKGEKLQQETRGWNEAKNETFLQRSKEDANDYRYFPEPDLPELRIEESRVESLESGMPELTLRKISRLSKQHNLSKESLATIFNEPARMTKFEELYLVTKDEPELLIDLVKYLANANINAISAIGSKEIEVQLRSKGQNMISDEDLEKLAQEVIDENPSGAVDAFRAGREAAIGVLIGALMKKTGSKADPQLARLVIEKIVKAGYK